MWEFYVAHIGNFSRFMPLLKTTQEHVNLKVLNRIFVKNISHDGRISSTFYF